MPLIRWPGAPPRPVLVLVRVGIHQCGTVRLLASRKMDFAKGRSVFQGVTGATRSQNYFSVPQHVTVNGVVSGRYQSEGSWWEREPWMRVSGRQLREQRGRI